MSVRIHDLVATVESNRPYTLEQAAQLGTWPSHFDFLLLHAMHAVLTQRLLIAAESLLLLDFFFAGAATSTPLPPAPLLKFCAPPFSSDIGTLAHPQELYANGLAASSHSRDCDQREGSRYPVCGLRMGFALRIAKPLMSTYWKMLDDARLSLQ